MALQEMNPKILDIDIDGIALRIAVTYRYVSGDLVFFIHGLGCSKESFHDVLYHEGFQKFSILQIDLAGFGDSTKHDQFSYTIDDHARVCEKVLKRFQYDRLHIVAHSMGGAVGLLLSNSVYSRTVSFSNIEGNLIGEDCRFISRQTANVSFDAFKTELFSKYKTLFHDKGKHGFSLKQAYPPSFYRSSKSLVAWSDSRRLLRKFRSLRCKKTYFHGDQNSDLKVLKELTNIRIVKISGSGHFVMNDNPEEFYEKLLEVM